MRRPSLFVLAALAAACGSSSSTGTSSGASSSGTSGTPTPATPGAPTVASCGDAVVTDVAGTWEVIATQAGKSPETAKMTIDASTFTFEHRAQKLAFAVNGGTMTLTFTDGAKATPLAPSRTASTLDVGLLPLSVGGQWTFASTTGPEKCDVSVGTAIFDATCVQAGSTVAGRLDGTLVGQRTSKLSSLFGELGGTWHLVSGSGTADVTIADNQLSATTSRLGNVGTSGLTMRVCNGTASGKTTDGFELSATRL